MFLPCPEALIGKPNQTGLRVSLSNGSTIRFVSGETLDNLKGETLHGAIIDETGTQKPELWPQVIRPMLSTTKGWCSFVGTPKGFNAFYDIAEYAKTHDQWEFFHAPSTCNPLFTKEEFDLARSQMSDAEFAQEILAEFRDLHDGSAYVNFSDSNCRDSSPFLNGGLHHTYLPVYVFMDFNLSPMSWVLAQERSGDVYCFDEIFLKKSHTQEASAELIGRIKQLELVSKPKLILIGDATGKAGQRAAAGKSDYGILMEMLTDAGISYENKTPESNPLVKDRVNVMNSRLRAADGTHHLFINPKTCPNLKKDLQRVTWKKGASMTLDQTTDTSLTHTSDAVGYGVCVLHGMYEPKAGGLSVTYKRF